MPLLAAIGEQARAKNGDTFAAGMAHTLVSDAVPALVAQFDRQGLAGGIAVRGIVSRMFLAKITSVVQQRVKIGRISL